MRDNLNIPFSGRSRIKLRHQFAVRENTAGIYQCINRDNIFANSPWSITFDGIRIAIVGERVNLNKPRCRPSWILTQRSEGGDKLAC